MENPGLQNTLDTNDTSTIDTIYAEAWKKTKAIKTIFWQAVVSIILVFMITTTYLPVLSGMLTASNGIITTLLHEILRLAINIFILMPLFAGLVMIFIKNCTGIPAPVGTLFCYFHYWHRLWIFPVVFWILQKMEWLSSGHTLIQMSIAGIAIIAGILFFMSIPLAIEKNIPMKAALIMSYRTILKNALPVFGFLVAIFIILFVTAFSLGIGLIWTLPWIGNAIAIFYRELFGTQISLIQDKK